jgi:hypothetical protein
MGSTLAISWSSRFGKSSWSGRLVFAVSVLFLVAAGLALAPPALAAGSDGPACPAGVVPDAGFTDIEPGNPHDTAIDCIAWYEITTGKTATTYDPNGSLLRWEMALFLNRTFEANLHIDEVPGNPQGFTDIGGVSLEAQKAINQLKELSITSGTSPTTFEPQGLLTRAQMALFMTRLMRAEGILLPDGADQGFTDIGGLSAEAQKAINQMKQLGITSGVTPTTYDPSGTVTRAQMASFLARSLNAVDWAIWDSTMSCEGTDPEVCTGTGTSGAYVPFRDTSWWVYLGPPPASPEFLAPTTRVELTVDGRPIALTENLVTLNAVVYKYFIADFTAGVASRSHIFEWRYYDTDTLYRTETSTILFGG